MKMLDLFFIFFKIGAFTLGGGYAMVPLIEREVVMKKGLLDEEELLELISLAQMTPGVIAVNTATFTGRKIGGIKGAVAASVGVILPSLLAITLIFRFFSDDLSSPVAQKILIGVRAAIMALLVNSLIRLFRSGVNNIIGVVIMVNSLSFMILSILSPIKLIISGATFGLVFYKFFPENAERFMRRRKK